MQGHDMVQPLVNMNAPIWTQLQTDWQPDQHGDPQAPASQWGKKAVIAI